MERLTITDTETTAGRTDLRSIGRFYHNPFLFNFLISNIICFCLSALNFPFLFDFVCNSANSIARVACGFFKIKNIKTSLRRIFKDFALLISYAHWSFQLFLLFLLFECSLIYPIPIFDKSHLLNFLLELLIINRIFIVVERRVLIDEALIQPSPSIIPAIYAFSSDVKFNISYLLSFVRKFYGYVKVKFLASFDKLAIAELGYFSQHLLLIFAQSKTYLLPAFERRNRGYLKTLKANRAVEVEGENCFFENMLFLLVGFVTKSDFIFNHTNHLRRKLKFGFNFVVGQMMQGNSIIAFLFPSYIGNVIHRIKASGQGFIQYLDLLISGIKFTFNRYFHIGKCNTDFSSCQGKITVLLSTIEIGSFRTVEKL